MSDTADASVEEYNVAHFGLPDRGDGGPDVFRRTNPVGTLAPDFAAVRLRDLAEVKLSDYLGKGHVVLEFGSVT